MQFKCFKQASMYCKLITGSISGEPLACNVTSSLLGVR